MPDQLAKRLGDEIILDLLHRREDQLHQSADALDTKAGLILAAAAFLAMQPAYMLTVSTLTRTAIICQVVSFLIIVLAVCAALWELDVADYPTCGVTEAWRDEQVSNAPVGGSDDDIRGTIRWGAIDQAKLRVDEVCVIQERKAKKLQYAQRLTGAGVLGNIISILVAYFTRHV